MPARREIVRYDLKKKILAGYHDSCSSSVPNPERTTLDDTATLSASQSAAEERQARHAGMCQELADLAMQLARAAANRALEASQAAAKPAARLRPKLPDPTLAFTRLSSELRQLMVLETRLAAAPKPVARVVRAGKTAAPPSFTEPAAPPPAAEPISVAAAGLPDERRTILRRAFAGLTVNHPHRVSLRRIIAARIDDEVAADPAHRNPAANILLTLGRELGLDVEGAKLPRPPAWARPMNPHCTGPPRMIA